ncbi:MAG: ankyrin repeat domain-containing protein [Alphaproteobacteria bacterium]
MPQFEVTGIQAVYFAAALGDHRALKGFKGLNLKEIEPAGNEGTVLFEALKGYADNSKSAREKVAEGKAPNSTMTSFNLGAAMGELDNWNSRYAKTIGVLLEHGANMNGVDTYTKESVLMLAAKAGFEKGVKLLVQAGADRAAVDAGGKTAADHARASGHTVIADYIANPADTSNPLAKKSWFPKLW